MVEQQAVERVKGQQDPRPDGSGRNPLPTITRPLKLILREIHGDSGLPEPICLDIVSTEVRRAVDQSSPFAPPRQSISATALHRELVAGLDPTPPSQAMPTVRPQSSIELPADGMDGEFLAKVIEASIDEAISRLLIALDDSPNVKALPHNVRLIRTLSDDEYISNLGPLLDSTPSLSVDATNLSERLTAMKLPKYVRQALTAKAIVQRRASDLIRADVGLPSSLQRDCISQQCDWGLDGEDWLSPEADSLLRRFVERRGTFRNAPLEHDTGTLR